MILLGSDCVRGILARAAICVLALTAHGLPGVKTYNVPSVAAGAAVLVLVLVTLVAAAFGARRLGRVELP